MSTCSIGVQQQCIRISFLKNVKFSTAHGLAFFQNPRGLLYDSPIGTYCKLCTVVFPTTDISSNLRSVGSNDLSSRDACSASQISSRTPTLGLP